MVWLSAGIVPSEIPVGAEYLSQVGCTRKLGGIDHARGGDRRGGEERTEFEDFQTRLAGSPATRSRCAE